jgi:hypothetical protein
MRCSSAIGKNPTRSTNDEFYQSRHRQLKGIAGAALDPRVGIVGENFPASKYVSSVMAQSQNPSFKAPEWFLLAGGCGFILVLAISAYWEADIRWLHFFQAWMYIATIALGLRGNRWGYFIGASAAGLWNYSTIFANTFLFSGLEQLSRWIHTGELARPDLLIAVPAWLSNLLVIIGCMWGYSRLAKKPFGDAGRFLVCFALTTGFFALDMALFQPRYLALFGRLLHPHLP